MINPQYGPFASISSHNILKANLKVHYQKNVVQNYSAKCRI